MSVDEVREFLRQWLLARVLRDLWLQTYFGPRQGLGLALRPRWQMRMAERRPPFDWDGPGWTAVSTERVATLN